MLTAVPAAASTIGDSQVRRVTGKVEAVDLQDHAVVVDVPRRGGDLDVGVTMEKDAKVLEKGKRLGLDRLVPGERVALTHTRKGSELLGPRIDVRPAAAAHVKKEAGAATKAGQK